MLEVGANEGPTNLNQIHDPYTTPFPSCSLATLGIFIPSRPRFISITRPLYPIPLSDYFPSLSLAPFQTPNHIIIAQQEPQFLRDLFPPRALSLCDCAGFVGIHEPAHLGTGTFIREPGRVMTRELHLPRLSLSRFYPPLA